MPVVVANWIREQSRRWCIATAFEVPAQAGCLYGVPEDGSVGKKMACTRVLRMCEHRRGFQSSRECAIGVFLPCTHQSVDSCSPTFGWTAPHPGQPPFCSGSSQSTPPVKNPTIHRMVKSELQQRFLSGPPVPDRGRRRRHSRRPCPYRAITACPEALRPADRGRLGP